MRNKDRIGPFLEVLEQCWRKYPDWRFMQLICNVQAVIGNDGFYLEDDMILERLKNIFELEE